MLRTLTRDDVKITISCLPEDEHPKNCFALDDPEEEAKLVQEILDKFERNVWAWCCIRVRVAWNGHYADEYLGCCSYESEEDFVASDYYYPHMVDAALKELNKDLQAEYAQLQALDTERGPGIPA